jgi:hypothetical protein
MRVDQQKVEGIELLQKMINQVGVVGGVVCTVADDLLEGDAVHGGAQIADVVIVLALLLELKTDCACFPDFLVDVLFCFEPRRVVDDQIVYLLIVLLSGLSQLYFHAYYGLSGHIVAVGCQSAGVVPLFEQRQQ